MDLREPSYRGRQPRGAGSQVAALHAIAQTDIIPASQTAATGLWRGESRTGAISLDLT